MVNRNRYVEGMRKLIGTSSYKTEKGESFGYLTGILYLAPADTSGLGNLCAWANNCKSICLNTSGRGKTNHVQKARLNKTIFFLTQREAFMETLFLNIKSIKRKAERLGLIPCIRLNGTSDLAFHRLIVPSQGKTLMDCYPEINYYDYSKSLKKALDNRNGLHAKNYHVTFSRDGYEQESECFNALDNGVNVAMVFEKMPLEYKGYSVINGDETDLRFLDKKAKVGEKGFIIGLKPKGKAKKDTSGFVIR